MKKPKISGMKQNQYFHCSISDSQDMDTWFFEKNAREKGFLRVAGIDEVGRGPLAGPVVSAAVILPHHFPRSGVTDSKKLTQKKREQLFELIYDQAVSIGLGIIDPAEIDRRNILQASLLSMAVAIRNLNPQPDFLLIDGIFNVPLDMPQIPIPKGDSRSTSIAAASIVAKVTRDRMMKKYHEDYPQFGFDIHKGYPTPVHKEAIRKFGSCPIHRLSFKGVKEYARSSPPTWEKR